MSTFSDPACLLVAWSQGTVGTVLAVSALVIGGGLYWRYQWAYALVISFVISLACYFEPDMILDLFNITPQSCQETYQSFESDRHNLALCQQRLPASQTPGEYCSCTGASPVPSCQSYTSACDSYLPAYQTLSNSCSCTDAEQDSSAIPKCTYLSDTANMQQSQTQGNQIILSQNGTSYCVDLASGNGESVASGYNNCMTYSQTSGFSGCLNIGGTAQVGYVGGENSGFCGNGDTITANSQPPTGGNGCPVGDASLNGQCYPESTQIADGGPITYSSGKFSGSPIVVYYLGKNGQTQTYELTPNGSCLTSQLNGQNYGEYCP